MLGTSNILLLYHACLFSRPVQYGMSLFSYFSYLGIFLPVHLFLCAYSEVHQSYLRMCYRSRSKKESPGSKDTAAKLLYHPIIIDCVMCCGLLVSRSASLNYIPQRLVTYSTSRASKLRHLL